MKFIIRLLTVVALLVPMCSLSVAGPQAQPQAESKIITFDAPGGGTASGQGTLPRSISPIGEITGEYYDSHQAVGQGTFPKSINPSGEIAGFYYDASHVVTRGFVRDRNGVITTFDGALPMSINPRGQTTGTDSGGHGFVRDSDGTITTFDAGPIGTFPQSINPSGEITG